MVALTASPDSNEKSSYFLIENLSEEQPLKLQEESESRLVKKCKTKKSYLSTNFMKYLTWWNVVLHRVFLLKGLPRSSLGKSWDPPTDQGPGVGSPGQPMQLRRHGSRFVVALLSEFCCLAWHFFLSLNFFVFCWCHPVGLKKNVDKNV